MAAYLIDTGRPGLDFMSQSTDTNLPSWPASGPTLGPASFDSAQLIEFCFTTTFFFAIRALGIDAEYFFHRIKVKKTSAKIDQTMWKTIAFISKCLNRDK